MKTEVSLGAGCWVTAGAGSPRRGRRWDAAGTEQTVSWVAWLVTSRGRGCERGLLPPSSAPSNVTPGSPQIDSGTVSQYVLSLGIYFSIC